MTGSVRIAQIADIHLGAAVTGLESADGTPVLDPVETAYEAFRRLLEAVRQADVDGVIIAGDIFDRAVTSDRAVTTFQQALDDFHDANLPTVIISGNHDIDARLAHRVRLAPTARWLDDTEPHTVFWDQLGIAVHGQSVGQRDEHRDLAAGYPEPVTDLINIGVLHTSLQGEWSRRVCAPTALATLTDFGYHAWALGHVHERRQLATTPSVTYSGSVHASRPAETGGHGFIVLQFGPERSVTPIDTAPVRFETAAIAGTDPTRSEVDELRALLVATARPALDLLVITIPEHTSPDGIALVRELTEPFGNVLVRVKAAGRLR